MNCLPKENRILLVKYFTPTIIARASMIAFFSGVAWDLHANATDFFVHLPFCEKELLLHKEKHHVIVPSLSES
jgi:hypothetical protein